MATDSNIDLIKSFWFDPSYPQTRWFIKDPKLDTEISTKFGTLVSLARTTSKLDHWTDSPSGSLALLLLLDQFPRNIYRGSAESYSSDQKALAIATGAIARAFDREVPLIQQAFFYLPIEHDERLTSQDTCVDLFEGLAGRCEAGTGERESADKGVEHAIRHRHVIKAFGRFPSRNSLLHRQSTMEELEFLKIYPLGF